MFRKPLLACLIVTVVLVSLCITVSYADNPVVRVGVHDIEPLAFKVGSAMYDGLAIDILEHIANQESLRIEYVHCKFSDCLSLLESGDIDLHSVIAYSETRADKYNFTKETIFNDWSLIYTRQGLTVESVLDLEGLRVALMANTIQYKPFVELVNSFDVKVELVEVDDFKAGFKLIEGKEADTLVINRLSALIYENKYPVEKTSIIFNPIDIRYAAPMGKNQELLDLLDKYLLELKNDRRSLYYESIERLFGIERGERMPVWHYWVLYGSLGLIALFMIISMIFRAQVRKRTQELREELNERKRIEREVFQGKQDWEETFDTITDIITIHDKDFTIIRANKAASRELNIPWDKIYKAKCFEYYHGTDCPPESCASCQSLETGEPTTVEQYEPHLNKYVEIRAIPRKDKEGNIVGLIHVIRDITQRQKAYDALRESEEKFSKVFKSSPDAIVVSTLEEGTIVDVNEGFEKSAGLSRNQVIGRTTVEMDFWVNSERRKEFVDSMRESGRVNNFEANVSYRAGEEYTVLLSSELIEINNKPHLITIIHDISERKRAEEALRESESKYRTLVDNSLVGIFRTNIDGEILFINDAMVNLLGYDSQEDIMQRNIIEIYERPEDRKELIEAFRRDGRVDDYELAGVKKDGEKIVLLVSSILEGETISGMLIDITQRKRMERTVHLASIGELAAGVAHEINNPTNSIINYAQVMQDRLSPETKEGDYADRIIKEGNRIAGIVKGLLSFARSSGGEKISINIEDVLKEALLLTRTHFKKNNIKIKLDITPDLPKVMANHQQIEQVFLNILSNAQYALNEKLPGMQEGKEILITCNSYGHNGNEYVKIIFHDNGAGMSPEILSKVSAPFFTTKPAGRGTGLGLSISHGIINDHNGKLNIESREGEFATVTLEFPVKD